MASLRLMDPGRAGIVALCAAVLAGCGSDHGLMLDVSADQSFTRLRVEVKGPAGEPFYLDEFDVEDGATRDFTADPYRLAIKLPGGGDYGVHLVDVSPGVPVQAWSGSFQVSGVEEGTAHLRLIGPGMDLDGDGWVSTCWAGATPAECALLDCDDDDAAIHPFAIDLCTDTIDQDCSGAPAACDDADGDGYDSAVDCDDNDPEAHPREPGFCEGVDPYCDNGRDEDCVGGDAACGSDEDCDGSARCPGAPDGTCDCDDMDAAVHPGATEICEDGADQDCDGDPDNGCDRCDEDGDGWYGEHPERGCSVDPASRDCDDADRAVNPGATGDCGGQEGTAPCTTRGYCALPAVDEDCDGIPNDGCPAGGCDADLDGYAPAACGPPPALTDCNDMDPSVYPGAPDRCGDGVLQNCSIDLPCTSDADGDGYNATADCDDGNASIHPGAPEVCDGVDQDCDGVVDEGNPGTVAFDSLDDDACNDDNDGVCAALTGRCVCSPTVSDGARDGSNRVACPAEVTSAGVTGPRCFGAVQPSAEQCDNLDQDCDVSIDEMLTRACSTLCEAGTDTCNAGVWTCDAQQPEPELCDGLDNDCNGTPDNGLGLGVSCDGTDTDQCNEGTIVCNSATLGTMCSDMTGSTTESCNSLDDDCDGSTDEGFGLGVSCDGGDADFCNEGVTVCNAMGTGNVCSDTTGSNPETCNSVDDDCDGSTDEGFALGVSCDGTDGDLCNEGVTVCNAMGTGTTCSDMTSTNAELCDTIDNDCDGTNNEGFTLGTACDGTDGDLCIEGVTICNAMGTGTTCSDATGTSVETCNGLDDDCDLSTDEMATGCSAGTYCSMGACACDGTSCTGCCAAAGATCYPGTTLTLCGTGGATCVTCDPVRADGCTMGVCTCAGGTICMSGKICCADGVCRNSCP